MKRILTILFLSLGLKGWGQTGYPQDFRAPLDIELDVSGSFCELRSNHFHSGVDLRTQRVEGLKIYAIGDGYISRIRISHYGYGKAIYVTHPNGYVSLYAHLQRLNGAAADMLLAEQYRQEAYEVDLVLEPGQLPVKKGEVIGFSGNTGSSQGPHLHFEIRDAKTEEAINPMLFGLKLRDSKAPTLQNIRLYPQLYGTINGKSRPQDFEVSKDKYGNLHLKGGSGLTIQNAFVLGLEAKDGHDVSGFTNGLHSIELLLDGKRKYFLRFDRIGFDELRYINAHLDYAETLKSGRKIELLRILPNDILRNYDHGAGNGILLATPGVHKLKLILKDYHQNTTTFEFSYTQTIVQHDAGTDEMSIYHAYCKKASEIDFGECRVYFPEHSLYDDLDISFLQTDTLNAYGYPYYKVHNAYTPVHEHIRVGIKHRPNKRVPDDKLMLVYINPKGELRSYGGKLENGWLSSETNDLGVYTVMADTVAPKIMPQNVKDSCTIKLSDGIRFKVQDNFSGIRSYRCTVDGKFILLQYEYKKEMLFYTPDGQLQHGWHKLKLEVFDERGNRAVYQAAVQVI